MKIFSLTNAAIACLLLLLCTDIRAASDPREWVEDSFRHNGQEDIFVNRHPLGAMLESAIGLALLPLKTWQQWQHRHHDGLEQFRQRPLRARNDGESLR